MYCHLHYCPGVDFLRFAKLNAEFSKHLLHLYSCEVYDQIRRLVMLGTLTARQRLEQLLLQMISSKAQKEMRLKWPLKLEEVAQLIAVQPEHLSRLLKQMEEEGIIQREKGGIVVSDPQRLFNSNEVSQTRFNERRPCCERRAC
jgi:CRP-like cAMP-binding protein